MTKIAQLGGRLQSTDAPQAGYDLNAGEELYFANTDIPAGTLVMLDTTDTTYCRYVTKATVAADHAVLGVYEGVGGTGAAATAYATGKNAKSGDQIIVRTRGASSALSINGTTNIALRDPLLIAVTTVDSIGAAACVAQSGAPTGSLAQVMAMETLTTGTATTKIAIFLRC